MTIALWIIQALLAALFVFAGAMKLVMPIEMLTAQSPLPGPFIQFIGVAEVLGGLGLILPGVLRIQRRLTVLAAIELTHVMVGAVVITVAMGDLTSAIVPCVVGVLAAFVAYARWQRLSTSAAPARRSLRLQPAA